MMTKNPEYGFAIRKNDEKWVLFRPEHDFSGFTLRIMF
jgi:hypothetical protein